MTTLTLDFLANTQHKRVRRLVSLLPPTRGYGFEQRLGDADFLHFFAVYGDAGLLKRLADNAPWPDVRRCAREVKDQLWLEFDCGVDEPVPFLFAPTPNAFEGLVNVATVLNGKPLSPPLHKQLARVVGCLPSGAYPFQLGIMGGIRLYLNFLSAPHMQGYLESIGCWTRGVKKALEIVAPVAGTLALSLDITEDGISPRVGIEFAPPNVMPTVSHEAWNRILDALEDHGFKDPGRREFWLSWPQMDDDEVRILSHCKVVCVGREVTDAKIYFGTVGTN